MLVGPRPKFSADQNFSDRLTIDRCINYNTKPTKCERGARARCIHIFFSVDSATPSLKDLRQHIIPRYATQWRVIGTLLGLPSAALDSIAHDYEAFRCCFVMLKKWLEVDPTASWSKLLTVIESPAVSGSAPYKGDYVCIVYVQ